MIATNKRGGLLALGAYNPRRPIAEAVAEMAPDVTIDPVEDYMMVSGSVAPGHDDPAAARGPRRRRRCCTTRCCAAVEGWHPALRGVVERIDRDTLFAISVRPAGPDPARGSRRA